MKGADDTARLLDAWRDGDNDARDRIFELLYDELKTLASMLLNRERRHVSLSTGDLVNEAIVRLFQSSAINVGDKQHLFALSARVMRHVLIDAAKSKGRQKRKGVNVTLTRADVESDCVDLDLLALDRALMRLNAIDPARAEIVEMRYFSGMTIQEIATVQGVAPATVNRIWAATRLWLLEAIRDDI